MFLWKALVFLLPVRGQSLLCAALEVCSCCWRGLVALARRGLCAEEGGDLSALATPPAAPASPGNLSLPHAPTHEQKTEFTTTG